MPHHKMLPDESMILKHKSYFARWILFSGVLIVCLFAGSCGGKKSLTQDMTPKEHFEYAMSLFDKKRYLDAIEQFTVIVYKYAGSEVVDDAQYYLAETYFRNKDYLLAASEYERLFNNYPQSPFVDDALYKTALSYYELSPKFSLDQKFTYEALKAARTFMDFFPSSELFPEVQKIYDQINYKLARKMLRNARTYVSLSEWESAVIYIDLFLERFFDSEFRVDALYLKGYAFFRLRDFNKAEIILSKLNTDFPESEYVEKVNEILLKIQEKRKELDKLNTVDQSTSMFN